MGGTVSSAAKVVAVRVVNDLPASYVGGREGGREASFMP